MDGDDSYTTSRVCLMRLKRTPKKMIKMENYAMYVSPQKETDAKRAPRRVTRGRNGVSGRGARRRASTGAATLRNVSG